MTIPNVPQRRYSRYDHRRNFAQDRVIVLPNPLPIITLILATLLVFFVAYQTVGVFKVFVGNYDHRFISGVHELEPLEDTGRWMRWTTSEAQIDMPLPAAHQPLIFDINLMNHYPHELADHPDVDLYLDDTLLLHFIPDRASRHYRLLIPPQERFGWNLSFSVHSTVVIPETDHRDLGSVLVESRIIPMSGFPIIPPLWQIAAILIGILSVYTMLYSIGTSRKHAWIIAFLLAIIWAYILARFPMQVAPFTMRMAGLALLGAIYGVSVKFLNDNHWVSIVRLPLMMGVAYWLMPIYQIMMTVDGVKGVSPYPPTIWVGGAVLLVSIVGTLILAKMHYLHHWTTLLLGVFAIAAIARLIIMLEFVMANTGVAALCVVAGFGLVLLSQFMRSWKFAGVSLATLLVLIGIASLFDPWLGRSGPDFWILFKGAREWFRGGSLYNIAGIEENHFGHSFKVPPFYGMLFLPFVQKDGLSILFWHRIMNMLLLASTCYIMLRGFHISLFSAVGAGLIMLFNMRPVADTVAYGQIDIVLLFWLTMALVASQRGYDGWAGAVIALATLFKLYPVLLLAFFVAKRQWRALIGFALAMLVCNGIAILVIGWDMHMVYLFEVIPRIRGGTSWVENQTLNGFMSRLFAPGITSTVFHHPIVSALTYIGFGIATIGSTLLAWQPADRLSPRYMLQFTIFVVLLVLFVPAAWMHYQTVTILTFVALLIYTSEVGLPTWAAAFIGGAYALIAYGNQWSYYLNKIMGGLTVMGVSFKFYGLLLLLTVVVSCILDKAGKTGDVEYT